MKKFRALGVAAALGAIPFMPQCAPATPPPVNYPPAWREMACEYQGRMTRTRLDGTVENYHLCYWGDRWGNTIPTEADVQLCVKKVTTAWPHLDTYNEILQTVGDCGSGAREGVGRPLL